MGEMGEVGETAEDVAVRYGLRPLPVEGGLFRRTWAGAEGVDGRPAGSAIIALLSTAPGDFSAMHRLPVDEVWHFYRGDALELLLLAPDGSDRLVLLGAGGEGGEVQYVVPAGTWMGARVVRGGRHGWGLFGTTMAPGFVPRDYEGGNAEALGARYPGRAALIRELCRVGGAGRMPDEIEAGAEALGRVPGASGRVVGGPESVPGAVEPVAKASEQLPEAGESVPEVGETVPEASGRVPEAPERLPGALGPVPGAAERRSEASGREPGAASPGRGGGGPDAA